MPEKPCRRFRPRLLLALVASLRPSDPAACRLARTLATPEQIEAESFRIIEYEAGPYTLLVRVGPGGRGSKVSVHGQLTTSAGTAAGIDCCLHLLRRDYGSRIANSVARRLVVSPHRQGGQAQFVEQPLPASTRDSRLGFQFAFAQAVALAFEDRDIGVMGEAVQ